MAENKRDFNADRAICDAATAGPWIDNVNEIVAASDLMCGIAGALTDADNNFIAEARTGWPAALDRIVELEAENERLQARVQKLDGYNEFNTQYITDLSAENQRYRQALESIVNTGRYSSDTAFGRMYSMEEVAREALGDG